MKVLIFLLVSAALTTVSCEVKSSSDPSSSNPSASAKCYDEELYNKFKDKPCPTDCPGMMGCDGHVYCNECEANRHGIIIED